MPIPDPPAPRPAALPSRLLTVCTGNICRSPLAALALLHHAPGSVVASAGMAAVTGADMDPHAAEAARALGLDTPPHRALQMTEAIGRAADLILVMETHHRSDIARRWPHLTGKTFLLGRFLDNREIPDPYLHPPEVHREVATLIDAAAAAWARHLPGLRA